MAVISMKQFLEAGVHFGHQTKRWHPNMAPYIYGIKNGVHVIDLRQTLTKLKEAYEYVKASAEEGRTTFCRHEGPNSAHCQRRGQALWKSLHQFSLARGLTDKLRNGQAVHCTNEIL